MASSSGSGCGGAILKLIGLFIAWIIVLIAAANFSENRPYRTADVNGFTDVRVVSSTIWFPEFKGCGPIDAKVWHVEATKNKKRVSFLVCGGLFGGNQISVR